MCGKYERMGKEVQHDVKYINNNKKWYYLDHDAHYICKYYDDDNPELAVFCAFSKKEETRRRKDGKLNE